MKKKLPVIIAFIAIIAFSIWYGFTDKTHKIFDNNVNTAKYVELGVLNEGESIEQTFTCEENTLNSFLIKCSPVGNRDNSVVYLEVKDAETGEVISKGEMDGKLIRPRKLNAIPVEAIEGYKGKDLILCASETGGTAGNGISFYYQPGEVDDGKFILNENPMPGVFVIKTVTHRFDLETCLVMFISIMFIWVFMWFLYRLFK